MRYFAADRCNCNNVAWTVRDTFIQFVSPTFSTGRQHRLQMPHAMYATCLIYNEVHVHRVMFAWGTSWFGELNHCVIAWED